VRLASPLQSTVPGTGLGLYLSRKLAAEVLKGDILLDSEYGRGEPVYPADPGEDAMEKVLVVEDNKDNLRLITYATKRQCHGVNGGEINEYSHCR
jgi:signal transduction histidine kinase